MTSEETIYKSAREEMVPDTVAKLMIAQSQQETGNFTSAVFKDDNNGFGMKVPSIRKDPYIKGPSVHANLSEGKTPYAHYDNLADSTKSLVNWMRYNKIKWSDIDTPEKYATVLKSKGYYGDALSNYLYNISRYYDKLKGVVFRYSKPIAWVAAVASFFIVGYGIFIITNRKKLK